jgi:hypothetical protein
LSITPIAIPIANVIANPIPNIATFGCAVKGLTILSFIDINIDLAIEYLKMLFKSIVVGIRFGIFL